MKKKIDIDIVSDVACPWCYVGKRRLEEALNLLPEYEAKVHWHPFQLDPTIPAAGTEREAYFKNKFGSIERYEMLAENLIDAGLGVGIKFDFKGNPTVPNTMKMHQLLHIASQNGFADSLKERLLKAYFENGIDLTKDQALIDIMAEHKWSSDYTQSVIDNEEISNLVTQEIKNYQKMGVTGVPFFILDKKYAFSGAQPPEVFINAIKEMEAKQKELEKAEACAIDDPNC
ncbi:MAG: putative DsbA family dithiol-disulfide isomerase [Psychromonas sp.]|jgi:predicted DsbA family dithiol-disulfide isomerase